MWQRRTKRVNVRGVSNLCPNCFSTLVLDEVGSFSCSGDRLTAWKNDIDKYKAMNDDEQKAYLQTLDSPSKFVDLVGSFDTLDCGYNVRLNNITPGYSCRIADPMAVARLERILKRPLTEEEQEEGHEFILDGKAYFLPMVNFPDDL